MSTKSLTRPTGRFMPSVLDDFFKPWNEYFDQGRDFWNRSLTVPAVNIMDDKDEYRLYFAVPGMKKDDFNIDVEGNMITISCEKEESKDEKEKNYTRREYNFYSFNRSFTLPEEVNREKIEATYENGLLMVWLPKKEEAKKFAANKHIAVK
ncbi:MAG TPA: Hsp20/alpha crystallin family protein [Chitinophagaceae bacterium]|nr:Hsp20/alpha crystallin family protein [Chitinophagaceae bacterium]